MSNISNINDYYIKAQNGDVSAQKQLGMLLVRSNERLYDGVAWLKKAAESDSDAMYMLARVCLKKLNDPKQAFQWYEKAAECEHTDAMIDTGACYLFGFQTERNISKALEWYKKAAKQGSAVALHNLGFISFQDPELYPEAIRFFERAMNKGYADSAYMLGVMYLYGYGVEKNPSKALEYLMASDRLGKHYACRPIGDLCFQGAFDNGKQNPDKAIEWYLYGAQHGELSCIEVLGDCYYNGFGVNVDLARAYGYYKEAAEKGSADSAFMLGLMYSRGEYVTTNFYEALKWMTLAEKRGKEKATQFVKLINDVLENNGAASASVGNGGSVGIKLRSSYSAGAEAVIAEQKAREAQNRKKYASIYAAAGAMSGEGSYTDYEMGAVISADGEVSYVDTDLGIILGADGSVSSHDSSTGLTYNWGTGNMMAYNETFNATMDLGSGNVSYNFNGYTL